MLPTIEPTIELASIATLGAWFNHQLEQVL